MGKLSQCVFKWDEDDLQLLTTAKREEMILQGVVNPSEKDVRRNLSSTELALHCKRVPRGTEETQTLISGLIQSLDGPKGCDTLGVPLFESERIAEVWRVQQQHVSFIQDPEGVHLYTQTGTLKKGGVSLPVYRCARGSTSLESFHLHMNRFIPGTLANDINFQVFLLDGLFRWNLDREAAAVRTDTRERCPRTCSGPLKNSVNKLSLEILGEPFFGDFRPPGMYTGELIGIEYLYSQTGKGSTDYAQAVLSISEEDNRDVEEEDEGFEEIEDVIDPTIPALECHPEPVPPILPIPSMADYEKMLEDTCRAESAEPVLVPLHQDPKDKPQNTAADDDVVGPDNIPGYGHVLRLATFLVSLRDAKGLLPAQLKRLKDLWRALSDYDKMRTVFSPRHQKGHLQGRFKSPRKRVAPGVEKLYSVQIKDPHNGQTVTVTQRLQFNNSCRFLGAILGGEGGPLPGFHWFLGPFITSGIQSSKTMKQWRKPIYSSPS